MTVSTEKVLSLAVVEDKGYEKIQAKNKCKSRFAERFLKGKRKTDISLNSSPVFMAPEHKMK